MITALICLQVVLGYEYPRYETCMVDLKKNTKACFQINEHISYKMFLDEHGRSYLCKDIIKESIKLK